MAVSTISTANLVTRFQSDVQKEYVRGGRFGPHTGTTENAVFQINNDLKKTSIPLVAKLSGAGVNGSTLLGGAEEALSNFAHTMQPTYWRNGVLIDNEENEKAEFDLFQEARPALMNWAMEKKRDQMIQALGALEATGVYVNYGGAEGAFGSTEASAANMDTWNTSNQDRVLYGALLSNNTSGNHTTSLATLDNTNDKLSTSLISLSKRLAEKAQPLIRPIMVKSDEPWYVLYTGTFGFRDLEEDSAMQQANRDARPRVVADNPLFSGGDLVWDGVIIKKVPEIDSIFIDGDGLGGPFDGEWGANAAGDGLDNAGASSIRVSSSFMCGGQAVGFGIGRLPTFRRKKEDDYEHLNGVGLTMKHDIKKTFINNKQHGVFTIFHAAVADA